jgi:hypothetical protein
MIVDLLAGHFATLLTDIASGQNLHIFPGRISARQICPGAAEQVPGPLASHADEAHRDSLAWRDGAATAKRRSGNKSWNRQSRAEDGSCSAEELTTANTLSRAHEFEN